MTYDEREEKYNMILDDFDRPWTRYRRMYLYYKLKESNNPDYMQHICVFDGLYSLYDTYQKLEQFKNML